MVVVVDESGIVACEGLLGDMVVVVVDGIAAIEELLEENVVVVVEGVIVLDALAELGLSVSATESELTVEEAELELEDVMAVVLAEPGIVARIKLLPLATAEEAEELLEDEVSAVDERLLEDAALVVGVELLEDTTLLDDPMLLDDVELLDSESLDKELLPEVISS